MTNFVDRRIGGDFFKKVCHKYLGASDFEISKPSRKRRPSGFVDLRATSLSFYRDLIPSVSDLFQKATNHYS